MPEYDYLLIGGGMTADAAARGIRELDEHGRIGLISAETDPPYSRPPLSKGLWQDQTEEDIDRWTESLGVDLHLGERALAIDRQQRHVSLSDGRSFGYRRLLLATGGTPRRLKGLEDGVIYYRTLADFRRLQEQLQGGRRKVLILGGGYIGAELAAALVTHDHEVHMAFPERFVLERLLPAELAQSVSQLYTSRGVTLHRRLSAESVRHSHGGPVARFDDGTELLVDVVVAGLGIIPETGLAEAAGLQVADGIIVNEFLQTSDPDIFAAGDVASIHYPALGGRQRSEHEENANSGGLTAGRNMAGAREEYTRLPLFYADLFDVSFEGAGVADSRLDAVSEWTEPGRSGRILYIADGTIRGVLLWNSPGGMAEARKLIGQPATVQGR